MQNKYQSEIAAAVHEDMRDMFKLGVIDKQTMRTFDELCLVPVQPMTAEEIRTLREPGRAFPARVGLVSECFKKSYFRLGTWRP